MKIDFYFDFISPTIYLAHKRLKQLSSQYDVQVNYMPIYLAGIFKATKNSSPTTIPAKAKYLAHQDLPRFAKRYHVNLAINPHFPFDTLTLMRAYIAAKSIDCGEEYCDLVFDCVWSCGVNLGDQKTLVDTLNLAGCKGEEILAISQQLSVKGALKECTDQAINRGIFGSPTMFIGDEMYYGQDRLDFVEEELQKKQVKEIGK
jgi:2-hydroxychromene-2-carboxylate isomerase